MQTAADFADENQVICVLKDEHTVTALPDHKRYLNLSGNPGMATAGSGDVLSGLIGALMAQKLTSYQAAPLGVYLHGLAGDIMGTDDRFTGPYSLGSDHRDQKGTKYLHTTVKARIDFVLNKK